ncbi:MAG: L-glutamate gamma-semialdehyde dehydrogenase [Ignavibacteriales bacterium]|nr:L-glutamate gamma-semialdehyde dehydrogenase [Ignavibacteriales bacterium]
MKLTPFKNEPILNFKDPKNHAKQVKALQEVQQKLGKKYPLIIGGEEVYTDNLIVSYNPSNKDEVIGEFAKANKDLAVKAVETAAAKFEEWKQVPAEKRAGYIIKAAKIAKRRRFEINAWMILEAGKNYVEADADTAEAIDFLEFYAREMLRYDSKQPITKVKGEENELVYLPIGVWTVIPPWNFPFAILVGMTSAAIVTGNTVVLKPSSDAPMMGQIFNEIMKEAGLPVGVLNFVPGSGGEVGDTLVGHPKTRAIAFTGSMAVGIHINKLAAEVQEGQIWLKRVIAEMGGKDGIVVDGEADVDAAAEGVVASAFGFQGQKCSACSRVIVDQKVYDKFVNKVQKLVEQIKVGPARENYQMGPVIGASAEKTILEYIEIGKNEGRLLNGGKKVSGNGYFIEPTVFVDVDPKARISQEEIFGPVLAILKAKDFDDALKIANDTVYGLTGAVYSKNKKKLERARKEFFVGNLYLNRKCTGALVGGHPFGGFNLSGTDSKAGGRDYLLLFLQAKLTSKKITK